MLSSATAGVATGLGTGTLILTSGIVQTGAAITALTNNITFGAGGSATLTNASPLTIGGAGTTITLNGTNVLTVSGPAITIAPGTTFTGTGTLLFAGTATVNIPGAVTVAGTGPAIGVQGTTLNLGNAKSLGNNGGLALGGGTVNASVGITSGGGISFLGGTTTVNLQGPMILNGAVAGSVTGTNIVILNNTLTANNTTLTGTGSLTLNGTSTSNLALTGSVSYSGATVVNGGILTVGNFSGSSGVTVAGGATLRLNPGAPTMYNIPLTLNGLGVNLGTGIAGIGALEDISGKGNTWAGTISLNSGSAVAISNTSTANSLLITGVVSGAGTISLVKVGSGRIDLQTINTYSGSTIVNAGTLALSGNGTTLTTAFAINPGASLTLDNTGATNISGRATVPITLNGGTLNFLGNPNAASSDTVGAVTLAAGSSTINSVIGTGQTATLTLAGLSHTTGATVAFTGTGTTNLTNVASVPLTGGILPYATVNAAAFATYSGASNTVAAITPTGTATLTGLIATGNYQLTANVTVPVGGTTINSLDLNGFNITSGGTLTVSSGGVINSNAAFITQASTLNGSYFSIPAGASTANLDPTNAANWIGNLPPTATQPLTQPFSTFYNAAGTQISTNSFTPAGPNVGTVNIAALWSGFVTIPLTASATQTWFTGSDDGSVLWINGVTTDALATVNNNNAQGVTFRAGQTNLTPGQTYPITIAFYQGTGGAALNVMWDLTGGNFPFAASGTPPSGTAVAIPASAFSILTPVTSTISAPLAFAGAEAIFNNLTNAGIITVAAPISGNVGLTVAGAGAVNLNASNSYTGATSLASGTLDVGTAAALNTTGALNLTSGTFTSASALSVANSVNFSNSAVTFTGTSPITFTGPVNLSNSADNVNSLTLGNTAGVIFTGAVGGTGGLALTNSPTAVLNPGILELLPATTPNSFSGGFTLLSGDLVFNNNSALGASSNTITATGGILIPTTAVNLTNSSVLLGGSVALAGRQQPVAVQRDSDGSPQ